MRLIYFKRACTRTGASAVSHVESAIPPPGAHLATPRRGYVHHGIHVGNGKVIHYAGFSGTWRRGPVQETTLDRFCRGRGMETLAWPPSSFAVEEIVNRARSRLGEAEYSIWSNNCEHFCEWCGSGVSRSRQVEVWRERFAYALAWMGGWMPLSRPAPRLNV
ncbi:lecithin retinol acyltransferase family protein [Piscinibacter defluvii]|uniref:lecithin retinol acyltransferase family protein n=1 Tax=Piscinibacter defluvii TaxID=1796922 RepID=UPI0013E3FBDF|nr:lecithin retinol acyltransferase family protein [Piscinibacter defluvii]